MLQKKSKLEQMQKRSQKWEIWQLNLQIHLKIFYLKLEPGSI